MLYSLIYLQKNAFLNENFEIICYEKYILLCPIKKATKKSLELNFKKLLENCFLKKIRRAKYVVKSSVIY